MVTAAFFFVYNPALFAQHPSWLVMLLVSFAGLLGVGLIAYAAGVGARRGPLVNSPAGYVVRAVLVVSGVLLAAPEPVTDLVGLAVAVITYAVLLGAAPVRAALLGPRPTAQ
jgi:TRAP-type uncharacterized transport system fused permease subunit